MCLPTRCPVSVLNETRTSVFDSLSTNLASHAVKSIFFKSQIFASESLKKTNAN